ncbi:class I SAM-dependent methyltransferase [Vibrio parahaemolyticus]|nr:class I SAM-dependent methyltransferase [Vibrio parahaemolyticus]
MEITTVIDEQGLSFILSQSLGNVEVLYDCGSSVLLDTPSSAEYKKKFGASRPSRAVVVHSDIKPNCLKSQFIINNMKMSAPLEDTFYYQWLERNECDTRQVTGNKIIDKANFLNALGFHPDIHFLSEDTMTVIKHAHDHFFFNKLNEKEQSDDHSIEHELSLLLPIDNTLVLPQKQLKHYKAIKNLLLKAGGKYKKGAFHFEYRNVVDIQKKLIEGEELNDKKKYQMFFSPDTLADEMMIDLDLRPEHRWMEPSCGDGRCANRMARISDNGVAIELNPQNFDMLKHHRYATHCMDFMEYPEGNKFDRILANPPFNKHQDIKHIRKMFNHLDIGGRLVTIASDGAVNGTRRIQREFQEWLKGLGASVTSCKEGTFSESGTQVKTVKIVISKGKSNEC